MRPLSLACLLAAVLSLPTPAAAQTGIGAQIGDPTGLSLRVGAGRGSVALAAGWSFGDTDRITLDAHYLLRDRPIDGDADLRLFYGPGVYVRAQEDRDTQFGASLGVGLSLYATREIELYGLVAPRLRLAPSTDFELGGGVGGRIYF